LIRFWDRFSGWEESFDLWLEEVGHRKPRKLSVKIKGVKEIIVGGVYGYEGWFMDGKIEIRGCLPAHSKPYIDFIHQKIIGLGYMVDGFGEYGGEVIVHYKRREEGEGG